PPFILLFAVPAPSSLYTLSLHDALPISSLQTVIHFQVLQIQRALQFHDTVFGLIPLLGFCFLPHFPSFFLFQCYTQPSSNKPDISNLSTAIHVSCMSLL